MTTSTCNARWLAISWQLAGEITYQELAINKFGGIRNARKDMMKRYKGIVIGGLSVLVLMAGLRLLVSRPRLRMVK
jgi:hypothetical protein